MEECAAPEGKEFSHWEIDGVAYNVGDAVPVTGDTVIKAVFKDASDVNGSGSLQNPSDGNGNGSQAWVAVVIIIVVLLVVAGIGAAVIIILKRKNSAAEEDTEE